MLRVWLQKLRVMAAARLEGAACDPVNPCSIVWVRDLGVFSIPAMALAGFAAVAVLVSLVNHERVFGWEPTEYGNLQRMRHDFEPYYQLWTMLRDFRSESDEWVPSICEERTASLRIYV